MEKAVTQLEAAKKEAGSADDLKKLVTALTGVEAMVKNRPEYNKTRTKRVPKVEKKKSK